MAWASLLRNPERIFAIYGDAPPDLLGVHVHEVTLLRDGPTLKIRFDLPHYPDRPPHKWVAQRLDTVQVEISFGGLRKITLAGFGSNVTADLHLSAESGIALEVVAPELRVKAAAEFGFLSKLTAYTTHAEVRPEQLNSQAGGFVDSRSSSADRL